MKDNYDFSNAKANPYADMEKLRTTIRLDVKTIEYFKVLSEKKGIPYQTLINLFLNYCVDNKIEPDINWKKEA
jgi:predicted DNA binding CopG/RHH family protein